MNISENTDHVVEALGLLLQQFKGKARIEALLSSYIQQIQDAEAAIYDLWAKRLLDTATGAQLDVYGKIVGQERGPGSEDRYRAFIKARIAINRGSSTTEEIITIIRLIQSWSANGFEVRDTGRASMLIVIYDTITEADADLVLDIAKLAKAGGVKLQLTWSPDALDDRFQLSSQSDTLETSTTKGLANAAQTTGGKLVGVKE